AVEVGDLAGALILRIVQVPEGDEAVAVHVPVGIGHDVGLNRGGDLALVDPDVLVQVGVSVVDAGVDVGDDDFGGAGGDVPGGRRLDAVRAVESPEAAVAGIVGHEVDGDGLAGMGVGDGRIAAEPGGDQVEVVAAHFEEPGDGGGRGRGVFEAGEECVGDRDGHVGLE